MNKQDRLRELINRLARLDAGEAWAGDLNPSQRTVLDYLNRANRFSRSPSHIAEYLGSTRGTVSQTLKSLGKKGYVTETRSDTDKRAIYFDLTEKGRGVVQLSNSLARGLSGLDADDQDTLNALLSNLLTGLIAQNNGRPFGICRHCAHFSDRANGGYCTLLSVHLTAHDTTQICHEQVYR